MNKIEVVTAQNVIIEYNLASVLDRIVAFVIDVVFAVLFFLVLLFVVNVGKLPDWMLSFVMLFVFVGYDIIFETFNNGMSPGKSLLRIKVIKLNGEGLSAYDAFVRWSFKLIDVYFCAGSLASLFVISSEKNQRLGDYLASTAVIKINRKNRMSLERIMSINEEVNYIPVYSNVVQLNNEEVLLVHETASRLKAYKNEVHQEAAQRLKLKLEEKLEVQSKEEPHAFFTTLIKDYVYLTR